MVCSMLDGGSSPAVGSDGAWAWRFCGE
jgi:hypothetical protein